MTSYCATIENENGLVLKKIVSPVNSTTWKMWLWKSKAESVQNFKLKVKSKTNKQVEKHVILILKRNLVLCYIFIRFVAHNFQTFLFVYLEKNSLNCRSRRSKKIYNKLSYPKSPSKCVSLLLRFDCFVKFSDFIWTKPWWLH